MRAFVIKRSNGKYLSKNYNYDYRLEKPCKPSWTDNILNAKIFDYTKFSEAGKYANSLALKGICDWQIVTIEIVEVEAICVDMEE